MVVMVIGVNVVFWRPLVAYAEKFRVETSEAAEQPKSYLARTSCASPTIPPLHRPSPSSRSGGALDRVTRPFGLAEYPLHATRVQAAGR